MSTREDMLDAEDRDENGYPRPHGPITRGRATIDSRGAPLNNPTIDQRTDNSHGKVTNPAIPWIIATGVAALSIGVVLGVVIGQDGRIQAEGRAVRAEVGKDFAERLAQQDAAIAQAKQGAELALDWTNQKNAELKAYRSK